MGWEWGYGEGIGLGFVLLLCFGFVGFGFGGRFIFSVSSIYYFLEIFLVGILGNCMVFG